MGGGGPPLSSPPHPLSSAGGGPSGPRFGAELSWLPGEACPRYVQIPSQFIKSLQRTKCFSVCQSLYHSPKSYFLFTTILEVGVAPHCADKDPKAQHLLVGGTAEATAQTPDPNSCHFSSATPGGCFRRRRCGRFGAWLVCLVIYSLVHSANIFF